jgi:hypothetical protein
MSVNKERLDCRREGNIKICLRNVDYEEINWIYTVRDRIRSRPFRILVISLNVKKILLDD